jgi:hypothetical protein
MSENNFIKRINFSFLNPKYGWYLGYGTSIWENRLLGICLYFLVFQIEITFVSRGQS